MDILNAIDKALLHTEPDQTPLTTAFFTELRRTTGGMKRNYPAGILVDGHQPVFLDRERAVYQIAGYSGLLCSEGELVTLRGLQDQMEALVKQAEQYSLANVQGHLHKVRDGIEADVRAGRELSDVIMPSRESVAATFRAKQSALVKVLVKMTHEEVVPAAMPILERFGKDIEKFMQDAEECDRDFCQNYGLEYHPSLSWKAAAHLAVRFTVKARTPLANAWASPRSILEGVVEI